MNRAVSAGTRTIIKRSTLLGIILAVVGVALLVLLGFLVTVDWLTTFASIFMFVVLAEGWNILGGYGGYLNFGMVAFFGVGVYTAGVFSSQYKVSPLLAIPLSGVAAVIFAIIVGVPALRLRGPYFAILTLIISFLTEVLANNLNITGGASGIYLTPPPFDPISNAQIFYYSFLALMVLTVLMVFFIEHAKFGYALVAIREDEDPAAILGVRTTQVKLAALLLGVFVAGIAGGIYAYQLAYIEPQGTFSLDTSIDVVLMSLVGGIGTWQGPLIGVPLMLLVAQVLRIGIIQFAFSGASLPPEFDRVIFGLILVLVALFAPYGIMGISRKVRGRHLSV